MPENIEQPENLLKIIGYQKHLAFENLNKINLLQSQNDFLLGMLIWISEAHGESITENYSNHKWKLKDYIKDTLEESYLKLP